MFLNDFNHISLSGGIWIRFTEGLISFGFNNLQPDIHYSVSFNNNSSYNNFHVTRNTNNADDKPQFKIACIKKDLVDELIEDMCRFLLSRVLEPVDLEELNKAGAGELRFIAHSELYESQLYNNIDHQLSGIAENIFEVRKRKRLRLKDNFGEELEKIDVAEEDIFKLYENALTLDKVSSEGIISGLLFSDCNIFSVLKIQDRWYIPRREITIPELLNGVFGSALTMQLTYRLKKGIVIVKNANSYKDIVYSSAPVEIIKNLKVRQI